MKMQRWLLWGFMHFGLLLTAFACAEAGPACECGELSDGACIPCPEQRAVDLPAGDAGVPFLNQEQIDENARVYLNQECLTDDCRFDIYTGEQAEIGVRVVTAFNTPAAGVTINFDLDEASGVRLQARSATSNEFGIAKVTVQAPATPTFVQLNMSGPNIQGFPYQLNIVARPSIDSPNGNVMPPNGPRCLKTKGTYNVVNRYQPASVLGDDVNQALQRIHQLVTDPGSFVGDLVADNIGGIAGNIAGQAVRYAVNYVFQYVVQNQLPDWAQRAIGITTGVTMTLTDLEIRGTIQLGDEDPMSCTVQGVHRWETLVFIWRDGCPPNNDQCGRYEIPMNELGISASETEFTASIVGGAFTDTLTMDEHRLQMNIGVAFIWFLERTVLPNYFNGINSFGDLLANLIPCDAVGDIAARNLPDVPFVDERRIVRDACRAGLRAAGQRLAREVADRLSLDTFSMTGECKLRDEDNNKTVDKLQEGVWSGQLQGTFTGQRR